MLLTIEDKKATILDWATRFWPRAKMLIRHRKQRYAESVVYEVITDSGNCVALAFVDPWDSMPWFKPTGSTEPDECEAGPTRVCGKS